MSNLELYLFYLLDWSDEVLDIREQYLLTDLALAIEIAEKANIRYPYDSKSGFPYVLTSDFYLETRQGAMVMPVKPSSELGKPRVREKLEIERRYRAMHNVQWSIITEKEIKQPCTGSAGYELRLKVAFGLKPIPRAYNQAREWK